MPKVFWGSTIVILASSLTIQMALRSFRQREMKSYRMLIGATIILGIIFGLNYFYNKELTTGPKEISSSAFNTYLQKGQIEKVVVYDKVLAEIYLNSAAFQEKEHSKLPRFDSEKKPLKSPQYTIQIGNEEVFQNKIEKAQLEGKLKDFTFEAKSNIVEYFLNALPFILIIGVWILIMRKMSSGGGGGHL